MSGAELTEKQAQALELVSRGYTTKEIARMLGIAPATVDQRVDGARRKLGTATRLEAARVFAASQRISDQSIYESSPLTPSLGCESKQPPPRDELQFHDAIFDERAPWDRGSLWRLPRVEPRDLGKSGRLLVIFGLALMMLLGAGEAVDLFKGIGSFISS
jgi:DNA-binding CsgD family transcriptional regulator